MSTEQEKSQQQVDAKVAPPAAAEPAKPAAEEAKAEPKPEKKILCKN